MGVAISQQVHAGGGTQAHLGGYRRPSRVSPGVGEAGLGLPQHAGGFLGCGIWVSGHVVLLKPWAIAC